MKKRVYNEELNNLYISTNTDKILKLGDCDGQVCSTEIRKNVYKIFNEKVSRKGRTWKM
jgi:hypothetical protein